MQEENLITINGQLTVPKHITNLFSIFRKLVNQNNIPWSSINVKISIHDFHAIYEELKTSVLLNLPLRANNEHLEQLEPLFNYNIPLLNSFCVDGLLDGLQLYAHLKYNSTQINITDRIHKKQIIKAAVVNDHNHCLEYLYQQLNWPVTQQLFNLAVEHSSKKCFDFLSSIGMYPDCITLYIAAEKSTTKFFRFLIESRRCQQTPFVTAIAARYHLKRLKFLHNAGFPWDTETCAEAASGNNLESLVYAHQNGCPWDETTCSMASQKGNLECLTYAHEHGCPWNLWTTCDAAAFNKLNTLKYACENECPYNEQTIEQAIINDSIECLEYLTEINCPINKPKICSIIQTFLYEYENNEEYIDDLFHEIIEDRFIIENPLSNNIPVKCIRYLYNNYYISLEDIKIYN